ncbi:MAG: hypothetical protein PHC56_09815 [Herbinix sp.]|nr:hypothetical protein [Herbinix sp.]
MSVIRNAINNCDSSKETEQIIKEQLETLAQLADAQNEIDSKAIEISLKDGKVSDDLKIPITKVIGQYRETHVVTKEGPSDIIDKIAGSIKSFFNPSVEGILTGVSGILGTALNALMGTGEGMEAKKSQYMVVVEYPAIIRFDFAMWVRNTRASGLMSHCKNAISVVAYKSAVDINKLDFATFLAIYAPVLNSAFGSDQTQIKHLIEESKDVYGMLAEDKRVRTLKPFNETQLGYYEQVFQSQIKAF